MNKRAILVPLFAALLPTSPLAMTLWEASMSEPTVEQLLQKTDDLMRGESSEGQTTMRVKTSRWDRTMTMKSWSQGTQKTLIQILSPPKERGTATLKVENNIWNYLPKVDRTIKVPASMMSGSWMGSHFTNDDLVKNSRFSDDYTCEFLEKPTDQSRGHYVINCIPKPEAPVVWGKVVLNIRAVDELIDEIGFYDEDDELVRTFAYDDIGDIGGRKLPRRVTVMPADKPEEFTQITYDELKFNVKHPERLFTLQALRK